MNDMTRIFDRLYVGSLFDAERIARSNPAGITTVFSLCSETLVRRGSGLHYVRVPVDDSCPVQVSKFAAIMASIAKEIRKGSVLLHCASGMSRSPIFAAAWMHRCGYRNFDNALAEISTVRPIVDPSPTLCRSVKGHLQ